MTWLFNISPSGWGDIQKLDPPVRGRVFERLAWFTEHFEQVVPLTLTGDQAGSFKLRVGDWRIVYEVKHSDQTVCVLRVEHRSKAYKKRR